MKIKKGFTLVELMIVISIAILTVATLHQATVNFMCNSKYVSGISLDGNNEDINIDMSCVDFYMKKYSQKTDKHYSEYDVDDIKDFSDKFIKNKNNIPVFVKYYCEKLISNYENKISNYGEDSNKICILFLLDKNNELMKIFEDNKSSLQDNNNLEKDNNEEIKTNNIVEENVQEKNTIEKNPPIKEEENNNKNNLNTNINNKNDIHSNEKDGEEINKRNELKVEISKEIQELNTKIMELENKIKDL